MRWTVLAVLSLVVAACSGSHPTATGSPVQSQRVELRAASADPVSLPPAPAAVLPSHHGKVVAQLQFRDHILVIRAGAGALRYDVQSRAGTLLAGWLTRDELIERFPAIADQFRDSTASIQLDASLDRDLVDAPR
jgi:hypothetical protein